MTEPMTLAELRSEIAAMHAAAELPSHNDMRRWIAVLNTHLAQRRCPGCGSSQEPPTPFETFNGNIEDGIPVMSNSLGFSTYCMACKHGAGQHYKTREEALAAFYAAD